MYGLGSGLPPRCSQSFSWQCCGPGGRDPGRFGAFFVTLTGSGSACTQSQPCLLPEALNKAVNGDTLYLAAGMYTGSGAAVVTVTQSITIYGGWDGSTASPACAQPVGAMSASLMARNSDAEYTSRLALRLSLMAARSPAAMHRTAPTRARAAASTARWPRQSSLTTSSVATLPAPAP